MVPADSRRIPRVPRYSGYRYAAFRFTYWTITVYGKKQYLTLAEVKKLAATPCKIPVLKQASLFSCMTGLRISDILQLTWDNIEVGPDNGYYIRICTEKTETEATLPISNEALELCGIPGSGRVFKGLTRAMTNQPLKQWIRKPESKNT